MIDNYNDLTLGKFMEVDAVLAAEGEELEKQVKILAILDDKSPDEVLLLPIADYARMAAQSAFLREPCKPTEIGDGWRLGDLVPTSDFRKINTAQYIDFQTFSKRFPSSLPELLSAFLIPDGKAYNDGYDVAEVVERVKALPLADALGLAAFFFARFYASIADSLTSWEKDLGKIRNKRKRKAIAEKVKQMQTLLESAGVGLQM